MIINIQELNGHWKEGIALDRHMIKSILIGVLNGENLFDNERSEIGECLYKLKYRLDKSQIAIISAEVVNVLKTKTNWNLHKIIPVPPSNTTRDFQPVYELAKFIGSLSNLDVDLDVLKKNKTTNQLKNIENNEEKREILKDTFDVIENSLSGKNILLFDDLFCSGETLNIISNVLCNKGNAANVYVLTITKTRNRK